MLYSILLSNSINSPEFTVLCVCSFFFCWIRIRNFNSGSRQKFRIHADPYPQHCLYVPLCSPEMAVTIFLWTLSSLSMSPLCHGRQACTAKSRWPDILDIQSWQDSLIPVAKSSKDLD